MAPTIYMQFLILIILGPLIRCISLRSNYTVSLQFKPLFSRDCLEEPFLTLYNLAVKDCVYECQMRTECQAVNYWRVRKQCALLPNNTTYLEYGVTVGPCEYVRKSDVIETAALNVTSICPDAPCAPTESCDADWGTCRTTECRKHSQPNATVHGNVLFVGSKIFVKCKQWYVPESGHNGYKNCSLDGTWSHITPCIYQFDCGLPPEFPNAAARNDVSEGNKIEENLAVFYRCESGYAAPLAANNMTIQCRNESLDNGSTYNNTWEEPGFICIRNCFEPADISNTTSNATLLAGSNLEGSVRSYQCDPGLAVSGNGSMTCQASGNWTEVDFQCVQECEVPPDVSNALYTSFTNNGSFSTVVYECEPGYGFTKTIADITLTCLQPGSWTLPADTCIIDCSLPPVMDNATVSAGDTLEGSTRNYTCIPGHAANGTGPTTTTCQPNGTWTTVDIRCQPAPGCPAGWDQIGSSCYIVPDYQTTIAASAIPAFCAIHFPDYDTYMVQLETQEEDVTVTDFLQAYSSSSEFCIGLHDPLHNGVWEWMETNEPVTYDVWCSSEPDGGQYYVVKTSAISCSSLGWRDVGSSHTCQPVCEIRL